MRRLAHTGPASVSNGAAAMASMVPEGFYSIARRQMNPNSHYYLSFDIGFPNVYDKAHGASGGYLMVHGTCSSAGCYAMTDKQIGEIYAIAREAFAGGQQAFQFQAFPFRVSAQNMARYRLDKNIDFWRQLKEGSDRFEAAGEEPIVKVVDGRYTFAPSRDPEKEAAAQTFHAEEEEKIASLISDGSAAIRTTYSDGGQHPAFAAFETRRRSWRCQPAGSAGLCRPGGRCRPVGQEKGRIRASKSGRASARARRKRRMHRVADSLDRRGRSAVLGAPARLRPGANGLRVVDGNGCSAHSAATVQAAGARSRGQPLGGFHARVRTAMFACMRL
jgi:hypothetical protein